MKKLSLLFFSFAFLICPLSAKDLVASYTPPLNWKVADPKDLPKSVKSMVVGPQGIGVAPSINLGIEPFTGSLKDYLKIVKNINSSQGLQWKDLGTIQTKAGTGSLSEVEKQTEWGKMKLMHLILVKDGNAYILTTASLKDSFSNYTKEFIESIRSFNIE